MFAQLAAFAGGFTMEAVTVVCADETRDEMDVLTIVTSLVDKSFVSPEPTEETMRYRLLESTRDYALEKLKLSGTCEDVQRRHARAYADFAQDLDERYEDFSPAEWLQQVEPEIENLRSALSWSFAADGEPLVGQRIATALPRIFGVLAAAEGLRWVTTAVERIGNDTPRLMVAGLELAHASFASIFNQFSVALDAGQRAIMAFMELQQPIRMADAKRLVGRSMLYLGRVDEGEGLLKESLASRQAAGSKRVGGILGDLAVARALRGDIGGARGLFARASAMFQEGADGSKLAITAATLAEAEFMSGDAEAALRLAEEALESARTLGRHRTAAAILGNIAAYHLHLRNYDCVKQRAREALEICCDSHADAVSVTFALQHIATAAVLESCDDAAASAIRYVRAAGVAGFVDARLSALSIAREHTEQHGYEQLMQALQSAVASDELADASAAGTNWSEERAVAEAMAL